MIFVRTFKGYEDKTANLDEAVNEWIRENTIDVVDVKSVLSHEPGGRAGPHASSIVGAVPLL